MMKRAILQIVLENDNDSDQTLLQLSLTMVSYGQMPNGYFSLDLRLHFVHCYSNARVFGRQLEFTNSVCTRFAVTICLVWNLWGRSVGREYPLVDASVF